MNSHTCTNTKHLQKKRLSPHMYCCHCSSLSPVPLFATLWIATHQVSLSFTISWKFAQTHVPWVSDAIQPSHPLSPPSPSALSLSQVVDHQLCLTLNRVRHELQHTRLPCPSPSPGVCSDSCPLMPSNHFILCHPLLLPSIFPSISVFSSESALCIRWPKYWSFNFSVIPSSEYSELISFSTAWFDLFAVQDEHRYLQTSNISVHDWHTKLAFHVYNQCLPFRE